MPDEAVPHFLDQPRLGDLCASTLIIKGWVVAHASPPKQIRVVTSQDRELAAFAPNQKRFRVAERYAGWAGAERPGFEASLALDQADELRLICLLENGDTRDIARIELEAAPDAGRVDPVAARGAQLGSFDAPDGDDHAADPIIVYGAPRSGTTYVREILNQHPQVSITHETRVFEWLYRALRRVPNDPFAVNTHRELFLQVAQPRLRQVILDFYRVLLPGVRYWGDKNPFYARNIEALRLIRECFPGARFIHVVRDGRDVVASLVRKRNPNGTSWATPEKAAEIWLENVRTGRLFGREVPEGCYFECRYEELIADDLGMAGRMFAFLDIPLAPEVRTFCTSQSQKRTPLSEPTRDLAAKGVDHSDWGEALSARDRETVVRLLRQQLVELGYETSSASPAPSRSATRKPRSFWR